MFQRGGDKKMTVERFPHSQVGERELALRTNFAIDIALLATSKIDLTVDDIARFARIETSLVRAHLYHLCASRHVKHSSYCKVSYDEKNHVHFTCTNSDISVEDAALLFEKHAKASQLQFNNAAADVVAADVVAAVTNQINTNLSDLYASRKADAIDAIDAKKAKREKK